VLSIDTPCPEPLMNASAATALPSAALTAVPGWSEMVSHRGALVRFAQRRLHDPMLAEDVVHDVFEAVLSGRAAFAGRSSLRSWLTAILKHKIVDLVRQRAGLDSLDDNGEDGAAAIESPQPRPDEVAEQRQLLARALDRIDALPAGLRDVMHLRVLQDQPTDSVCRQLSISEDNLFVRLHRARRQLLS
jgi:RNA polymerase sigma-70 factor (ECF subfamily)